MKVWELLDKLEALRGDERAMASEVMVDTEARTFPAHLIPIESVYWDQETCDAAGIPDFTVITLNTGGSK